MSAEKQAYLKGLATLSAELSTLEWDDPHQLFTQTLTAMARDAQRWQDDEWRAPNGDTTPIERAIVVLTQDLIVLLGHANNVGIEHDLFHSLRELAEQAVAQHVIEDSSHRAYFMIVDSETES
mgnify:FL=1